MEIASVINEDFLIFDHEITLSQMLGQLKQFEKRSGLVFKNDKYLGLVEKKRLLRTNVDFTQMKLGKLAEKTPVLDEHADVIETAYLMYQSNVDFLPVEKDKKIVGVVDGLGLVKLAVGLSEIEKIKVADGKLIRPERLDKDAPVAKAIEVMYNEHVDHVPVFDGNELYGIISFRDLLRRYLNWSPKRDVSAKFNKMASSRGAQVDISKISDMPVSSFSTNQGLVAVQKGGRLKDAVQLMLKNNISDILVMEGSEFKGLLTVKNILRIVGSLKEPEKFNIKFVGLSELSWHTYEVDALRKIAASEALKLQRKIHNDFDIVLHLKEYERDGKKHKYSVNLRMEFPGRIITSTQDDWDWRTAVRKTFNNAKKKADSQFKN